MFAILGLLGLIRLTLVVVTVRGQSMAPTLNDSDRVLALRHWPTRWLRTGQVVLVCPPRFYRQPAPPPFGFIPFAKRITGLPGAIVEVEDVRSVNPLTLDDAALAALPRHVWHVPAHYLFVRGDNPRNLADSRFWGPIPRQSVVGIVLARLTPAHTR